MNKRIFLPLLALLLTAGLAMGTLSANAADIAVVDTAKILSDSKPGKAGEAHLQKVQTVLQKGLDDLQKIYKGKEKSAEAQNAIREGYVALERQMGAERQAVLQVLAGALEKAIKDWRNDNKKYDIVMSRQNLLDSSASVDVTASVMKEMDKQKVEFPALPTVKVTPPTEEKKEEKKPAPRNNKR